MVVYINLKNLTLVDIMLPENNIKAGLSCSYLKAVANIAGYPVRFTEPDADFGIDATIAELLVRKSGRTFESGKNLLIQLKSTTISHIRENDTEIIYDLRNKNYNDLTYADALTPKILVLFVMPNEKDTWLTHHIEMLVLKKCAYWTYLASKPQAQNEESTTAIHIDKNKIFSPDSLKQIMGKVSTNGNLYDL
jgi:hypothetical protein